ncbi:TBC1 DOMAIN FAMILY MEMBER GTPASE-ACTIVATING PROTEIN [Salix koriyanagi]|uniref:TBC1 DOMAIN FAMILY MEMBER GTPASE-ACTIVATING PROTEIN n=1 Tax=Salix koriyanagi TaxID=2511006 RepID=A0A9Q0UPF0_9ROSI|nr:TBC1 DOMAIN FAMILY MEMBER GTPASE-ACTIVATING PROTEIN [Salix koriyanagi]
MEMWKKLTISGNELQRSRNNVGVDPSIRPQVWEFLLGIIHWEPLLSTEAAEDNKKRQPIEETSLSNARNAFKYRNRCPCICCTLRSKEIYGYDIIQGMMKEREATRSKVDELYQRKCKDSSDSAGSTCRCEEAQIVQLHDHSCFIPTSESTPIVVSPKRDGELMDPGIVDVVRTESSHLEFYEQKRNFPARMSDILAVYRIESVERFSDGRTSAGVMQKQLQAFVAHLGDSRDKECLHTYHVLVQKASICIPDADGSLPSRSYLSVRLCGWLGGLFSCSPALNASQTVNFIMLYGSNLRAMGTTNLE